jgi:hypothetical protein
MPVAPGHLNGQVKAEVQRAESKKGDVAQPIKPSLKAGIAPQPAFSMEKQTKHKTGQKPQPDPKPGQKELQLQRLHNRTNRDFMSTAIAEHQQQVLIEKKATAIDGNDAESNQRIWGLGGDRVPPHTAPERSRLRGSPRSKCPPAA